MMKTVAERGPWTSFLSTGHRNFMRGDVHHSLLDYARLAEMGLEVAQSNAAYLLDQSWSSSLFPKHYGVAQRYLQLAADQGSVEALRLLGDYAYYGLTGSPNLEKAAKCYTMASDHGNAHSMFNVGYMHEHGLGLSKDWALAKRYYDRAAETAVEAMIPARLALTKLWWHEKFINFIQWWNGETKNEGKGTASSPASSSQSSPTPSKSTQDSELSQYMWLFWNHIEDFMLLVMCTALFLIVYIRSQRAL